MTAPRTARPGQETGRYPPSARASVTRDEPDDRDDEIHTTRTTGSEIKSSSSHPWRLHAARAGNVGRSDGRDRDITHKEEYIMNVDIIKAAIKAAVEAALAPSQYTAMERANLFHSDAPLVHRFGAELVTHLELGISDDGKTLTVYPSSVIHPDNSWGIPQEIGAGWGGDWEAITSHGVPPEEQEAQAAERLMRLAEELHLDVLNVEVEHSTKYRINGDEVNCIAYTLTFGE